MPFEPPVDNDTLIHERILAITGDDLNTIPADAPIEPAADTPSEAAPEATPDTAPVEQSSEEIPATEEAAEASLAPPASWNAEEKEAFKALPLAAQQAAVRLEQGRQAHLSRRENEAAELRKSLETETAQARQARETFTRQLNEVLPALGQQLQGKWANVDWVKLSKDAPADYVALKAEYDRDIQIWQNAQAQKSELDRQQQLENQKLESARIEEQEKLLVERIPSWADSTLGVKEFGEVRQYLRTQGVPSPVVNQLSDAVQIDIARKAMLYDKAQTRLTKPAAAATAAPKVMKPGSARTEAPVNQAAEADRKAFHENPSVPNAAAMIKRMLK